MGKTYNEGKAQLEALEAGLIDQLGSQRVEVVIDNNIEEILFRFGEQTTNDIRQSIEDKKLDASGNLKASVAFETLQSSNEVHRLKFNMADYWEWAETGRSSGKPPPIQNIMEWITNKGIKVRQSKRESTKGVLARRKQMAYAISKNIAKKGTIKRFGYKGSKFLSSVITDDSLRDLSLLVGEITGLSVAYSIKSVFERENR